MSTHFPRKEIYKGTWRIPGRKETNQIDHVLVQERYAHLIKNVRTYRGADVDSDHFLVVVKMKEIAAERKQRKTKIDSDHFLVVVKMKEIAAERKQRKTKTTEIKCNTENLKNVIIAEKHRQEIQDSFNKKYNMEDLKNVIVAEKYSQEIQDNFNKADDINTVESKWKKLEKSIKAATERQLTKQKGNRKKEWLDEECKTEIEKRRAIGKKNGWMKSVKRK
ncbi:hypothetical protein QE152_g33478 [Popillia japonica]|uniref:Uncharacterized protein n=1 Tax=Popillia japonica TaxID=7064 RepID=A0AAW1IX12_POPJA